MAKESEARKIGPPEWLVAVVEKLTPASQRKVVAGDLLALNLPTGRFAAKAAKSIAVIVMDQALEEFSAPLLAGEASTFLISFARLPPLPVIALLLVTLAALSVRNAYIYPASGSAKETFGDAMLIAAIAAAAEAVFVLMGQPMVFPGWVLVKRVIFAALTVSQWRRISHSKKADPEVERARDSFNEIWTLNFLWLAACFVLNLSNVDAVPEVIKGRDYFLGAAPVMAFAFALRLQMGGPLPLEMSRIEMRDKAWKRELQTKRKIIYARDAANANGLPWYLVLEVSYFAVLALPLAIAAWEWISGDPAAARVDWWQVGMNSGMLVTLSALGVCIRRLNDEVARNFEAQIIELDSRYSRERDVSERGTR